MKSMSDRKMDMSAGKPMSEGYFPEESQRKDLMSPGEINMVNYPDTEQDIYMDQDQAVSASNRGKLAAGFRH